MSQGIGGVSLGSRYLTPLSLEDKVEQIYQQFNPESPPDNADIDGFLQDFTDIAPNDMPQCASYFKKNLDKIITSEKHVNNDISLFKILIDKIIASRMDNTTLSTGELIKQACKACLSSTIALHYTPTFEEQHCIISDPDDPTHDEQHLSRMVSCLDFLSYMFNNPGRMIALKCATTLIPSDVIGEERDEIIEKFHKALFTHPASSAATELTYWEFASKQA